MGYVGHRKFTKNRHSNFLISSSECPLITCLSTIVFRWLYSPLRRVGPRLRATSAPPQAVERLGRGALLPVFSAPPGASKSDKLPHTSSSSLLENDEVDVRSGGHHASIQDAQPLLLPLKVALRLQV